MPVYLPLQASKGKFFFKNGVPELVTALVLFLFYFFLSAGNARWLTGLLRFDTTAMQLRVLQGQQDNDDEKEIAGE